MERENNKHLDVPVVRKSILITSEKRKKVYNETFGPLSSPCATSTVEKQGYKRLMSAFKYQTVLV